MNKGHSIMFTMGMLNFRKVYAIMSKVVKRVECPYIGTILVSH